MMHREAEVKMDHWTDEQVADMRRGLIDLGELFHPQPAYRVLMRTTLLELYRRQTAKTGQVAV